MTVDSIIEKMEEDESKKYLVFLLDLNRTLFDEELSPVNIIY